MIKKLLIIAFGIALWFSPRPEALGPQEWHLFAIFITTIFSVVFNVFNVLPAAILALAITILTGTLPASDAFSGFSEGFILLILIAFLIAKAVVKSGLGNRIALLMISRFGHSSLGLAYSLLVTDIIIAPAFPSNTARSGVLFPVVFSLAESNGSHPDDPSARKLGAFLMFVSMYGLSLSSGLWLTAMAANPVGAAIAGDWGVEITFGSWFLAALPPTIIAAILVPFILYKVYPPVIKKTPHAPENARKKLNEIGKMNKHEIITLLVFVVMVVAWALPSSFGLDRTAVAFLGLGILILTDVFTLADIRKEGEALSVFIWFAILYTLSAYLNKLGFMGYIGELLAEQLSGFSWPVVYTILIVAYVLIHYLFVSQSAQLLALFGVFLGAGVATGVPPTLLALMLLFATNFFSVLTPQASSCNVLFAGSGYFKVNKVYTLGGLLTVLNLLIFMIFGTLWILLIF